MKTVLILLTILILIFVLIYFSVFDVYFSDDYAWPLYVTYNGITYTAAGADKDVCSECPQGYSRIGKTKNVGKKPSGEDLESNEDGYVYLNEENPDLLYFVFEHAKKDSSEPQWIPLEPVRSDS